MSHKRPPGRAPNGKTWDAHDGNWVAIAPDPEQGQSGGGGQGGHRKEFEFPAEWGETHTNGDDTWWGVNTYRQVVLSSMEVRLRSIDKQIGLASAAPASLLLCAVGSRCRVDTGVQITKPCCALDTSIRCTQRQILRAFLHLGAVLAVGLW